MPVTRGHELSSTAATRKCKVRKELEKLQFNEVLQDMLLLAILPGLVVRMAVAQSEGYSKTRRGQV